MVDDREVVDQHGEPGLGSGTLEATTRESSRSPLFFDVGKAQLNGLSTLRLANPFQGVALRTTVDLRFRQPRELVLADLGRGLLLGLLLSAIVILLPWSVQRNPPLVRRGPNWWLVRKRRRRGSRESSHHTRIAGCTTAGKRATCAVPTPPRDRPC